MPSYAEAKGIARKEPKTEGELVYRVKELEKALKKKEKELADEKEKVEIQKIPAHLYATTRMKCEAIYVNSPGYSVRKMCRACSISIPPGSLRRIQRILLMSLKLRLPIHAQTPHQ